MPKYPAIENPNFYKEITSIYSEFNIPSTKKTLKEICYPKKYEFQLPQEFLGEFINPETPYTGMLVYHGIGAGKTCASIKICEQSKSKYKIVVVLPAGLIGNYRNELKTHCTGEVYLTNAERKRLEKLHPSSDEFKEIIDISDKRIDKVYKIYSYNKFVDLLKKSKLSLKNTVLIIDEVHNMVSSTGIYYETLNNYIKKQVSNFKLVIMTATPIFDKPIEIALTMNLLIRGDKLPTGRNFVEEFIDVTYTNEGPQYRVKNLKKLKKSVKGYISYFRGAPPHVFPQAYIKPQRVKMSDIQLKRYIRIAPKDSDTRVMTDYINGGVNNSFLIGTRMISNFVFPNGKLGKEGYKSMKKSDYELDRMTELSPKFVKIFKQINKTKGSIFCYSSFKEYAGIKTFAAFLEHRGFKDYEEHGPGKNRFAIWSGDQETDTKDEIKAVFNNKNNTDGSQIKVILGSPSIKEGVSLYRVKQVHVMEPYWNMSRLNQVIGRAIRFCSHKDLPLEDQIVNVYIYISYHPKLKISADEHIMRMAQVKEGVNKQFDLALKEAAIDCTLFKNANVHPGEPDIKCDM